MINVRGIHVGSGLMLKSSVSSYIGVPDAFNLLDADQMKVEYDSFIMVRRLG